MFQIKVNIVNQRGHKEERKSQGSELFKVSLSEHTCGTKLWGFWREISILFLKWISMTGLCENLLLGAWKLQFPLVLTGTKCLMSHYCIAYCIHISCMNIPCMHIETTHHGIWNLTAQFSLTLLKLLLC